MQIGYAQEGVVPTRYNPVVKEAAQKQGLHRGNPLLKTTSLSLPFFDDFTGYYVFPDSNKWVDNEVYINNTMCVNPISRGVATFDALNQYGTPYDSFYNTTTVFADSLTSKPIDLSSYGPGDSLYLSFFYQPQGNGFFPQPQDSLMLFLHRSDNDWIEVWVTPGDTLQPFQQVMVPITDTGVFYNGFQFRFVNMATFDYAGSTWNVDYVKLGAHRNMNDTLVNDVAFNMDPTYILNDYTYMPYRQFYAGITGELATQHSTVIRNNYSIPQTVNCIYTANEITTSTSLSSGVPIPISIAAMDTQSISFPMYPVSFTASGADDKVIFENKYYFQHIANDTITNDTIVRDQVFDNYLAYDDGTAEKSYYLKLSATTPGEIAIEFHLNQPDTLQGLAIYFGRQIPLASYKFFNPIVYKGLGGIT
ncbi:MAG TPA: hypothetical protein VN721_12385, partial [Flavipsychrobacter sp.]|nr:hypothetical protein [Flavipsychrobacter sp.]